MIDDKSIEIFSSRDQIRNQIIKLTEKYAELENFDFNQTSYLSYLVNVLSVLDANLLYYVSSVYKELFLTKAITLESVLAWSSILGYTPELARPAVVGVLVEIPLSTNDNSDRIIRLT